MIDNFAIGLTHGLMLLAAWRLLMRPDLDCDDAKPGDMRSKGWRRNRGDADDA